MDNNVFQELMQEFHENKLAHAFLLETNDKDKSYQLILEFLKRINCPEKYEDGCSKCNLCHLISSKALPSLITVYPDGINIKKEQILSLKKAFQTKPVFSKYNMYIIMDAEKLNASSANTMLKFIEEPEEHIIGFFVADNKENVIDTIKSRCQIFANFYVKNGEEEFSNEQFEKAIQYILEVETAHDAALLYNKDVLSLEIKDKNTCVLFFKIMLFIYQNIYYSMLGTEELKELFSSLQFLTKKKESNIFKRIQIILKILDDLNYNLNISLVLDRFVLEVGDIE